MSVRAPTFAILSKMAYDICRRNFIREIPNKTIAMRPKFTGHSISWILCSCLLPLAACVGSEPAAPTAPRGPPPLPEPAEMSIDMDLTLNLPNAIAAMTGVPNLKAKLTAEMNAEAISACPVRSKYSGTVHFLLTDPQGIQTFINLNTTIHGEEERSPDDAVMPFLYRAGDAFELMARAMPSPATQPGNIGFTIREGHGSFRAGPPSTTFPTSH